MFACESCPSLFDNKKDLDEHKLSCQLHANIRNKCKKCTASFQTKNALRHHIQRKHEKTVAYQCNLCSTEVLSVWSLTRHVKLNHKEARRYFCALCPNWGKRIPGSKIPIVRLESFQTKNSLNKHISKLHIKCSLCTSYFSKDFELRDHVHLAHERYEQLFNSVYDQIQIKKYSARKGKAQRCVQCKLCQSWYGGKRLLNAHVKRAHEVRQFVCELCPFKVDNAEDLHRHTQEVHKEPIKYEVVCDNFSEDIELNDRAYKEEPELSNSVHEEISSLNLSSVIEAHIKEEPELSNSVHEPGMNSSSVIEVHIEEEPEFSNSVHELKPNKKSSSSSDIDHAQVVHINEEPEFSNSVHELHKEPIKYEVICDDFSEDTDHVCNSAHEVQFKCALCPFWFESEEDLHQHMQEVHVEYETCCDDFSKDIEQNVSKEEPELSNSVQKPLPSKNSLSALEKSSSDLDHVHEVHIKEELESSNSVNELRPNTKLSENVNSQNCARTFRCGLCPSKFYRKIELDWHVELFHEDHRHLRSESPSKKVKKMNKRVRKFQCDLCPSSFFKKMELGWHAQIMHQRFECALCFLLVENKEDLKRHKREVHKRLVRCEVCWADFRGDLELQDHVDRVHKEGQSVGDKATAVVIKQEPYDDYLSGKLYNLEFYA